MTTVANKTDNYTIYWEYNEPIVFQPYFHFTLVTLETYLQLQALPSGVEITVTYAISDAMIFFAGSWKSYSWCFCAFYMLLTFYGTYDNAVQRRNSSRIFQLRTICLFFALVTAILKTVQCGLNTYPLYIPHVDRVIDFFYYYAFYCLHDLRISFLDLD